MRDRDAMLRADDLDRDGEAMLKADGCERDRDDMLRSDGRESDGNVRLCDGRFDPLTKTMDELESRVVRSIDACAGDVVA